MVSTKIVISSKEGLHLKEAASICEQARRYDSLVTLTRGDVTANGKSILSLLAACVGPGEEIELVCTGPDEKDALKALEKLLAQTVS